MKKVVIYSVAIAMIGLIESIALIKGINGVYLALSIGAIGAIVGRISGKKF